VGVGSESSKRDQRRKGDLETAFTPSDQKCWLAAKAIADSVNVDATTSSLHTAFMNSNGMSRAFDGRIL
jgi:hypothetical protein